MSLEGVGKLIEKVCLRVFGEEGQFREMHNLIAEEEVIAKCYWDLLFGLMRAKTAIK